MKMKYSLARLLAAIASVFRIGAREEICNVSSSVGTHADGRIDRSWETGTAVRNILVQTGTAPGTQIIANVLATRPIGVMLDEPAEGELAAVQLLGCGTGTVKMVASAAITAGAPVYTAAAGKVSATYGAATYLVGRALTAAGADGDVIEVMHCFPMINGTATL
jgi:hypothetical protein